MYSLDHSTYPQWIRDALDTLATAPSVFLEFDSPRAAESARSRIYAYFKAGGHNDKRYTIRRAGQQLVLEPLNEHAPKTIVGGDSPTRHFKTDSLEQQLIAEHGLMPKMLKIGDANYFTITNDKQSEDLQYHKSLMEAIQAHLAQLPTLKPSTLSETMAEIQADSDAQMVAMGYGGQNEAKGNTTNNP